MTKSARQQTRETAKAMVNPLFAWSNAVLKGGELVLDSMQAAAETARRVRVAVLPQLDGAARQQAPQRKTKARRAKSKRRR